MSWTGTNTQQLSRADDIVTQLGGGADAIAAAIGLVAAEKNTNPFANGNAQNVCGDPALPATAELRGITPLIDPAVDVDGAVAALSEQTKGTPLNADGMSVFDLLSAAGFGDLVVSQAAAGGAAAGGAAAGNAGNANNNNNNQGNAAAGNAAAGNAGNANQNQGNAGNANQNKGKGNANQNKGNAGNANQGAAAGGNNAGNANQGAAAGGNNAGNANNNAGNANQGAAAGGNNAGNANQNAGNANNNAGNANQGAAAGGNAAAGGAAAGGAADFGKCTPTITFQGGEGNRPDTEFTFQIADPVARGGQGEALNPNIITNALCNQLTNVCDANAAAKALCEDAKAQVAAAGTRNKSTADLFNTAIGFAGAVTNPAGGPADVAAAGAKAARSMRRGFRA